MAEVKLTKAQRAALETLRDKADGMLSDFPEAIRSKVALSWTTYEPIYCWPSYYGFSFQSMNSLIPKGFAEHPDNFHKTLFVITDAGRAALKGDTND